MRLYSDAELAQILDKDIFRKISDAADSLGVECYVVGGFVRDIFLGRPSNDIDVVVVGSGIAVATELKKRLGRRAHLSVFRNFGTAQVKFFSLSDESVTLSDEGVAMSEKQEKQSSLNPQPSSLNLLFFSSSICWKSFCRSTNPLPRYFSRTMLFSASCSGVP